jgi:hypothetical protein
MNTVAVVVPYGHLDRHNPYVHLGNPTRGIRAVRMDEPARARLSLNGDPPLAYAPMWRADRGLRPRAAGDPLRLCASGPRTHAGLRDLYRWRGREPYARPRAWVLFCLPPRPLRGRGDKPRPHRDRAGLATYRGTNTAGRSANCVAGDLAPRAAFPARSAARLTASLKASATTALARRKDSWSHQ